MRQVSISGAIVGKTSITLFFVDGNQEILKQEDFRTQEILEKAMPILAKSEVATINLEEFSIAKKIEELTDGVVKATETLGGYVTLKVKDVAVPAKALMQHFDRAVADGSKGFQHFMEKFAEIKRAYTRDELLKFLEDADLPFMDDGSILGFKVLGQSDGEYMVDHHSGKVRQRLGSLVFMPESKVDQSRTLCSTGLHIAARQYIRGFWHGDSRLCLVKIHPKDVVSVPLREHSKMRVSAYHVIKVFSATDGEAIRSGTPIHDLPSALKLLEEAVAGDHGPIIETVEVRGYGEITVTQVAQKAERIQNKKARKVKPVSRMTKAADKKAGPKIDPKDVRVMNKLIRNQPHLADQEPKYLKKLVRAQRLLNEGQSLRTIADKLDMDRDALSRNLIRKAA